LAWKGVPFAAVPKIKPKSNYYQQAQMYADGRHSIQDGCQAAILNMRQSSFSKQTFVRWMTINQHTNFELNRAKHSEVIVQKQYSRWLPGGHKRFFSGFVLLTHHTTKTVLAKNLSIISNSNPRGLPYTI
jgi:hypothetical protein